MTATPARVVFLGSGGFAVPSLYRLLRLDDVDVVGVVSAPDRPAGRHGKPRAVPVAIAARKRDLPLLQPSRIRSDGAIDAVRALRPDVGVLADYGQIIPQALLDVPSRGILNLHPSLLPRHRGASPIPATILEGDAETGVTLIAMDAGLDTGPIVAQSHRELTGEESGSELEATLAVDAANVLGRSLGPWVLGNLGSRRQGEDGASLTKPLRREDGRLDHSLPAAALERQVRAYQPWPGSFIETPAGRLVVWRTTIAEAVDDTEPGTIGSGPSLRMATADRWLRLDEVQPAGGRRMAGDAWLRGRPSTVGSVVV